MAVNTSFYFLDTSMKLKIIHKEFDDQPVDGEPGYVEQSFQHEGILRSSKEEVKLNFVVNADLLANRVPIITTYASKKLRKSFKDLVKQTNILSILTPKKDSAFQKLTTAAAKPIDLAENQTSDSSNDDLDDIEAAEEEEKSKPHKTLMTVVVHTNEEPLVWFHREDEYANKGISRSLCIMDYDAIRQRAQTKTSKSPSLNKTISVVLNIALDVEVHYKVEVKLKDINLHLSQKASRFRVAPDSPAVWRYDHRMAVMKEDPSIDKSNVHEAMKLHRHIRVHVESPNKELCAMVAVQRLRCPFTSQESDVAFRSKWQTMLGRSVIDVDVGGIYSKFGNLTTAEMETKPFRHGFFVVALTKSKKDNDCYLRGQKVLPINDTRPEVRLFRQKEFHVTLSVVDDGEAVVDGTLVTLLVYIVTLTIALFLSIVCKVPISGTVSIDEGDKWTRPNSILLNIKRRLKKKHGKSGADGGSINHGLDDAGVEKKDVPEGVLVEEVELVDGEMKKNESPAKLPRQSPTDPSSPLHKASMAIASSAIADTIQLVAQPVTSGTTKKIVKANRMFHDIIDAECIFIELDDDANEEIGDEDETDIANGRCPVFGYETAKVIDPRLKNYFNDQGACIPLGKKIKSVHYKPNKNAIVNRRKTREPKLIDLSSKCNPLAAKFFPNSLKMKSDLYGWMILLVGIFYILPVSQLMFANQKTARATGNGDMCFYNFLCKRPLLPYVDDFGHIFSNIAYIFCGAYFIFLTWMRRRRRQNQLMDEYKENVKSDSFLGSGLHKRQIEFLNRRGIPEQYGVFYAMGGALIMEGFLSACYHVCPTVESFQFDTTFMYIMAVLVFLKVYQFRHPDVTSNAYIVFAFIALGLMFEVIGYYSHNWIFWTIFITAYIFFLVVFIIEVYFNGDTKQVMSHIWKNIIGISQYVEYDSLPFFPKRPTI